MRLVVSTEEHLLRTPSGSIHSPAGVSSYTFWSRYLEVFDHVSVAARVRSVDEALSNETEVGGLDVDVLNLPDFTGPKEFLLRRSSIARAWGHSWHPDAAHLFRVPGSLASFLAADVNRRGSPYGVEVIADPNTSFAPGASSHSLRAFFRWKLTRDLRRQVHFAATASYVTQHVLQRAYPPSPGAFATSYSDVELDDHAFVQEHRRFQPSMTRYRIATVGSLDRPYKRVDVLIHALATRVANGDDAHLDVVGEGRYRGELQAMTERLGLADRVCFHGQLQSGAEVRAVLDGADVFALVSQTEGLPRAMIEAMARGLPCIGSDVGGIPELLPSEFLVAPGDASGLAARIGALVRDHRWMQDASEQNLRVARAYAASLLRERRIEFLTELLQRTQDFLSGKAPE